MGTAPFEPPRRVGRRSRPAAAEVIAHALARRSSPLGAAAPLVPATGGIRMPRAQRLPIAGVCFGVGAALGAVIGRLDGVELAVYSAGVGMIVSAIGTTVVEVVWLRRRASVTGPPSVDSMTDR